MNKPKIGELWIHRRTGYTVIVKSLYTISNRKQNDLTIVKTIRTRDQYEMDEPIGMFTWEYTRLN